MAAEGGVIMRYIFTGNERDERGRYIIPPNVTRLLFHESVTSIPERLFFLHPNIVEVYCHIGVKRIGRGAFTKCPRLKRVIMRGVKVVELGAFIGCEAVTYVLCPKLEIIRVQAFQDCKSLGIINLPSAKVVERCAFWNCGAMTEAKFGENLETIGELVFYGCFSLKSITIPLKNGLFPRDDTFQWCPQFRRVDLIEESVLEETVNALMVEEWRDDMNRKIYSINQILPNASGGEERRSGRKVIVIREWISRVLRQIIQYKADHHRLFTEAASTLHLILPDDVDIVMNEVLPFLELPEHTFQGKFRRR